MSLSSKRLLVLGLHLSLILAMVVTLSALHVPSKKHRVIREVVDPTLTTQWLDFQESELFPLQQVFNGIRLVRTLALLMEGQPPPQPEVTLINY